MPYGITVLSATQQGDILLVFIIGVTYIISVPHFCEYKEKFKETELHIAHQNSKISSGLEYVRLTKTYLGMTITFSNFGATMHNGRQKCYLVSLAYKCIKLLLLVSVFYSPACRVM